MKKFEIETIEDVCNCLTPENVENFLEGFARTMRAYVTTVDGVRGIAQAAGLDLSGKKNTEIAAYKKFTYVDDGKQNNVMKVTAETKV